MNRSSTHTHSGIREIDRQTDRGSTQRHKGVKKMRQWKTDSKRESDVLKRKRSVISLPCTPTIWSDPLRKLAAADNSVPNTITAHFKYSHDAYRPTNRYQQRMTIHKSLSLINKQFLTWTWYMTSVKTIHEEYYNKNDTKKPEPQWQEH